jgi:tight adherence protein B
MNGLVGQVLILALVFGGTVLLLVGAFAFFNRRRLSDEQRARARLLHGGVLPSDDVIAASILKDDRMSDLRLLDRLLAGKSVAQYVAEELARAGSKRNVGEFMLSCAGAGALGAYGGATYLGGATGAVTGLAAGAAAPVLLLRAAKNKRARKFEEQLPDALDMLVNALRAGYSLQAATEFVGNELPGPLGPEFARFYDEQRLGVEVRTALLRLQARVDTYDIRMLVTALLIQRETGGNLGEVLSNIATLMRERVAFRGQVETLTAEPKMSAIVLSLLPIVVFAGLFVMSPDFVQPLLITPTGHTLLAYAAVSVAVGFALLMKIAKVEM